MLVLLQADGVAVTPLNVTVLAPCAAPNPLPVMVTVLPTTAAGGLTDVTCTLLKVMRTVYVPVAIQFGSSRSV
jgi:hypothetical protein